MICTIVRLSLVALFASVLSLNSHCYGQSNVFEGELKFLFNGDLVFDEVVTYLVKDGKVYKFMPPTISELTGGYSRESLEVTDSSITNILYNPRTGDSIVSQFRAWENHGVPKRLADTVINGTTLSGNLINVNVRGFIAEDSINIQKKIYYEKGKYKIREGQSNMGNNVFCSPQFEIPYCSIKYLKEKYSNEVRVTTLELYSAVRRPLAKARIHDRWFDIE